MLKRAWLLVTVVWIAIIVAGGASSGSGFDSYLVLAAVIPPALLLCAFYGLRWIFTGLSPLQKRIPRWR